MWSSEKSQQVSQLVAAVWLSYNQNSESDVEVDLIQNMT